MLSVILDGPLLKRLLDVVPKLEIGHTRDDRPARRARLTKASGPGTFDAPAALRLEIIRQEVAQGRINLELDYMRPIPSIV